jgi:predicted phosphoribosyltransferase/predicted alpha/beta-hydrolase family hydrolase
MSATDLLPDHIPLPDGRRISADVTEVPAAIGTVLFAHGSGSSRSSPRNREVARTMNRAKMTTVLVDLLTPEEQQVDERTRHLRFDIPLLATRLVASIDWLEGAGPLGIYGASTGAAAALVAAAARPDPVAAVVSRGGRPDLAGDRLPAVRAPTLLVVGSLDPEVLQLNQQAASDIGGEVRIAVVDGARHLFEEPGKLAEVSTLAIDWFQRAFRGVRPPPFADRAEAGRVLAAELSSLRGRSDVLVLGLPRGGVPVAYEVARSLGAPLDSWMVRKLGVPGHEELAFGAVAADGTIVTNPTVVARAGLGTAAMDRVISAEKEILAARDRLYRGSRSPPMITGRHVVLVDDGLATGATMQAAVTALKAHSPSGITVAVPVGSTEACSGLASTGVEVVCARTPRPLFSIGEHYLDFSQTDDREVIDLLARASG